MSNFSRILQKVNLRPPELGKHAIDNGGRNAQRLRLRDKGRNVLPLEPRLLGAQVPEKANIATPRLKTRNVRYPCSLDDVPLQDRQEDQRTVLELKRNG